MTDKFFKVSCRTIDGTMWFTDWQGNLSESKAKGHVFKEKCALALIEREKGRNLYRKLDDKHGQFRTVEVPGHNRHHQVKYRSPDWRKEKKEDREQMDFFGGPIAAAHSLGGEAGYYSPAKRNPYPPGKRHDAWQHGFDTADPMGNYHGRNV